MRKKLKHLKAKDAEDNARDMGNTMAKEPEAATGAKKANLTLQEMADKSGHTIPDDQNVKFWGSVKKVVKELEAAQDKIERHTRGLDKVEPGLEEENELNQNIMDQYDTWVAAMASAEGLLDGLEGSDAGVYWQRVAASKVTVQKTIEKAHEHFDRQTPEGDEEWQWDNKGTTFNTFDTNGDRNEDSASTGEDGSEESEASEYIQPTRIQCSTPFIQKELKHKKSKSKRSEGYGVSFKNPGQDTFISGLNAREKKSKTKKKTGGDSTTGGSGGGSGNGGSGGGGGTNGGGGNGGGNGNSSSSNGGGASSSNHNTRSRYLGSMKTQASNR